MSSLLDRGAGLPCSPAGEEAPSSPLVSACLAAVRAVGAGLLPVLVSVVAAWVMGAGGQATWSQAVRFAVALWLLAHHTGLAVQGGHVGLVPLGLVCVPLMACWFAGRRLARTLGVRAERAERAEVTRAAPTVLSWRVLAAFSGAYCVLACLASLAASMSGLRPVSGQALVGAAVISLTGGWFGAAACRRFGVQAGVGELLRWVPRPLRHWIRPAVAALAVWVSSGVILVAVMFVTHARNVIGLHGALGAGVVGGVVLVAAELALLPNLVVWACAVTAGPGISLGAGATVTLTASVLGPLPAVPVLAALPGPGRLPAAAMALLAVPVAAGAAAGVVVRRPDLSLPAQLRQVAGAAMVCGVTAAAAAWLSGGPAGPGRLADVGPKPLLTGLAFAGEVALGAGTFVGVVAGAPVVVAWVRAQEGGSERGRRI
jgi:hypothetical protein